MPDDFDLKLHKFITRAGRVRSRAEMRESIDTLTDALKRQAKGYAERLAEGAITRKEFENLMFEMLKSGHIVASSVGRGGLERMTGEDWLRVSDKIEWQWGYLQRFGRLIANDQLKGPASSNRAAAYAESLHISFYRSVFEDEKERGVSGEKPTGADGKELLVQLVQNSQEGCDDCAEDAARGFVPLDEMGDLGTRICGDFCKCDLEFSDEGIEG